jgi:hypothetical protein
MTEMQVVESLTEKINHARAVTSWKNNPFGRRQKINASNN